MVHILWYYNDTLLSFSYSELHWINKTSFFQGEREREREREGGRESEREREREKENFIPNHYDS